MTSNDFAANLYDIEVTFVTEAYGIGSIVVHGHLSGGSLVRGCITVTVRLLESFRTTVPTLTLTLTLTLH